ncbi:MAG: aminodeoxychorismate/anthranilate synthase component II [Methanomassiliicoccaceae archaeon]|nr:aminodeoxychorismate/anthranilate synthase component II [Methanomassiliicoccaceae archaeon]MCL2145717.1 aminodeoxychorismate/anthranilate synthase component II [Methanomassiliicoccaceae archaeon]
MILLIDNYDSFTYNLYQLIGAADPDVRVIRNDEMDIPKIKELNPSHIVISPGPGRPADAGVCEELVRSSEVPVLGVCLGHQAICEAFGARVTYAKELIHGKKGTVHIANGNPIFKGLPPILRAARYHSLAIERESLPDELLIIAEDPDGEVMGVKHRGRDIYGVQFHPESILTDNGDIVIRNFLRTGGGVK